MNNLVGGLGLLVAIHLGLTTPMTAKIRAKLGDDRYEGAQQALTVIALGLIYWGYGTVWPERVYTPPAVGLVIAWVLTAGAAVLVGGRLVKARYAARVRRPVWLALVLFSLAHLLVLGDHTSLLLFGTLAALGLWRWLGPGRGQPMSAAASSAVDDLTGALIGVGLLGASVWVHAAVLKAPLLGY